MENNYKGNSYKAKTDGMKDQPKKVEKVVSGKATVKKDSGKKAGGKLLSSFIVGDIHVAMEYVRDEVVIPAFKKTLSEAASNIIDMILYGEAGKSSTKSRAAKVSYQNYYDRGDRFASTKRTVASNRGLDYDDVVFDSRDDAVEVRSRMYELLDLYEEVTVADLYDMAGITAPHTFNNYGWTRLANVDIVKLRGGDWALDLPSAKPLR